MNPTPSTPHPDAPSEDSPTPGLLMRLRRWTDTQLANLHEEQSGAVALLVLTAVLIVFMMALVIYDTGEVARDNLEVQAAADTAAWSQTAVEARSMNMLAFANVGKKVTFGMTSYYQALIEAYIALEIAVIAIAVLCWVANFFAGGSITEVCRQITGFAAEIAYILFEEAPDIAKFETKLNNDYFAADMQAFDDYQGYMIDVTPWWSWSESFIRGSRNGATVASGWPVPKIMDSVPQNTGVNDALPVQRPPSHEKGYMDNMCDRVRSNSAFSGGSNSSSGLFSAAGLGNMLTSDAFVHTGDYILKSCVVGKHCTKSEAPLAPPWARPAIYAITPLMAAGMLGLGCRTQKEFWTSLGDLDDAGMPYEIQMFSNEAQWLMRSSNLSIAYKRATDRNNNDVAHERGKYGFISAEHDLAIPIMHEATGTWALSRAEMSFQFGEYTSQSAPDLWHPSWTVRMRPVALPGEWSALGNKISLNRAWHDALPYIIAGASISQIMGGDFDVNATDIISDLARIELSTRGLDDDNIEGLAK